MTTDSAAPPAGWEAALLANRARTTAGFKDGTRSPYAAVARHDFAGAAPLLFGSDAACQAQLPGLSARHLSVRVEGPQFVLAAVDPGATFRLPQPGGPTPAPELREAVAPPGAKVEVGRYVLRLSHQNFPGVVVLDPQSPKLATGRPPVWFPPAPAFRVQARLVPEAAPREEIVLSTRGNKRRALRLGKLHFSLEGKPLELLALRLLEPGTGEAAVSIFFRDQTTGHESYPVGRYVDAEALPGQPGLFTLDFNAAYNPTCAFSELYNCPIPPRENQLGVAVRAGEMDPGH
jgi:hypothetical protein